MVRGVDRGCGEGGGQRMWSEGVVRGVDRGCGQGVWSENVVRGLGQQKERSSCISLSARESSMSTALRSVKNCSLIICDGEMGKLSRCSVSSELGPEARLGLQSLCERV